MNIFSLLSLSLLLSLTTADYDIWHQSCTTGFGDPWDRANAASDRQGACGGCALSGEPGDGDFSGGNPVCPPAHRIIPHRLRCTDRRLTGWWTK
jgi:hypothetical protein